MQQLEFKFVWPLTEQIPLDLDYTHCGKPKLSASVDSTNPFIITTGKIGDVNLTAAGLVLDVDSAIIKTKEDPPLYRKVLYKLLGIKWEKK